nr:MAG TPA: hypothetical protein [Caudoviricetes sp.]
MALNDSRVHPLSFIVFFIFIYTLLICVINLVQRYKKLLKQQRK